jgi:hypothetical protein
VDTAVIRVDRRGYEDRLKAERNETILRVLSQLFDSYCRSLATHVSNSRIRGEHRVTKTTQIRIPCIRLRLHYHCHLQVVLPVLPPNTNNFSRSEEVFSDICAHLRHAGTSVSKAPIDSSSQSRAKRVGKRTLSIPCQRNGAVLERDESCATEEDVQGTSKYWLIACLHAHHR